MRLHTIRKKPRRVVTDEYPTLITNRCNDINFDHALVYLVSID